ncbi:MAG: hypothetical protein PHF86_12505 [Candidatus Nanoarchaeia archaeon]|nr:hypothetical protein [Candidatus Nanoarchaeia archaeon]
MIKDIIDYEELEFDNSKIFEKLIKDFNTLAEKNNSRFRLYFSDNDSKLVLSKHIIAKLRFGNNLPKLEINFNNTENNFYFEEGIDEDILEEIKFLLIILEQEFLVEVRR